LRIEREKKRGDDGRAKEKKKTGPLRPGLVHRHGGAGGHLPEGNSCLRWVAIWEDGATDSPRSATDYVRDQRRAQRKVKHVSHAKSAVVQQSGA
jgi:hypothetical protein